MPLLETASSTATDPAAIAVMPPPTAEDHTLDAQVQKLSPDSKLLFGCMSTLLDQKLGPVESREQTLEQERRSRWRAESERAASGLQIARAERRCTRSAW